MKRYVILLVLMVLGFNSIGQDLTIDDLCGFLTENTYNSVSKLEKMGYKKRNFIYQDSTSVEMYDPYYNLVYIRNNKSIKSTITWIQKRGVESEILVLESPKGGFKYIELILGNWYKVNKIDLYTSGINKQGNVFVAYDYGFKGRIYRIYYFMDYSIQIFRVN